MLQVREEHILEVLCAADMYLLPGLKRGCGAVLGSCLSTDNVVSRLKTARLFQLPHLEDQCTQFISVHIDKVVKYLCVCAWVGGWVGAGLGHACGLLYSIWQYFPCIGTLEYNHLCTPAHVHSFIHSIGMCGMRQFLAILRSFFHSSLLCTFSCHPSPPTIHPSSLTSSCHLFLVRPLNLVVPKFFWDFYFLPFSVHVQTNIIYLTLLSLL